MSRRKYWSRGRIKKPHRVRGVAVLPSLFTLGNAVCGFAAIYYAAMPGGDFNQKLFVSPLALAGYFVFMAILADAIDGRLARLARSASDFGGELDSLADVISFGVAPAFLLIKLAAGTKEMATDIAPIGVPWLGKGIWLIAAIYLCCTALRLARFNVENATDSSAHIGFKGLPAPAAAGAIASLVVLHQEFLRTATGLGDWLPSATWTETLVVRALPAVALVLALAMVSRIPYVHIVNQYMLGRRSFRHLVRITIFMILCLVHLQIALVCIFCGFALSGPLGSLRRRWQRAKAKTDLPQTQTESN
ncbi:MAG: CDP-diacylglycerol--serine O-phosphatidyltransferase [Actinobacteria bacterium]|nr:CDP-diacylglycerol--serine O-phosphatidyltransferase [Actinomycetota bacterium]